jgi:hypothetical protein
LSQNFQNQIKESLKGGVDKIKSVVRCDEIKGQLEILEMYAPINKEMEIENQQAFEKEKETVRVETVKIVEKVNEELEEKV